MRPKLILLLFLAIASVAFVAVLLSTGTQKTLCEKKGCSNTTPPPDNSGGGDMFEGSFHHMIVSTIK